MKEDEAALKFHALGLDEHRQPVVVAVVAMMVVDKKKEPTSVLVAPATSSTMSSSHCSDFHHCYVSVSLLALWSRLLLFHAQFILR